MPNAVNENETMDPNGESAEDVHGFLKGLVEAILFVTDRPLSIKELARAAKIDKKRTAELIDELIGDYEKRGIQIQEVAGGYCLRSSSEYATYVKNFLSQRPVRLSRAQLETLAIVAYRQPITRPEIDDIRGVDSGPVLKGLLERDVIKILGKKDEPGRPMLYGTTATFLELFNMASLNDLPTLQEFTELSDDSRRQFEKVTGQQAPEELPEATPVADDGEPPEDEDEDEDEDDEDDEDDDDDEDDER